MSEHFNNVDPGEHGYSLGRGRRPGDDIQEQVPQTGADRAERYDALPLWINHYNTTRPHSSIGNWPPINRPPFGTT